MNRLLLINRATIAGYCPRQCDCCSLMELYYSNTLLNRIIRKLILKLHLPGKRLVLNKWIYELENYDEIIVFDTGNAIELAGWIKKRHPEKRVILWYWNPAVYTVPVRKAKRSGAELWSFDPNDCLKYGLRYNSQFFMRENMLESNENTKTAVDVFYVGKDKNRANILYWLKQFFDAKGISYYFHLVQNAGQSKNQYFDYKNPMEYHEVLLNVVSSKAIIDLVSESQSGLTLRPIEALLYKKKLITNMKEIARFKIYNPKNVFILGVDNPEDLLAFINSPFDERDYESLCDYYMMEAWLERFASEYSWFDYLGEAKRERNIFFNDL